MSDEVKEVQQPVQSVEKQQETKVEFKVRDYTDTELYDSVSKNQSVYNKIYNEARDKFIAKSLKLEVKDLTDDQRKAEYVSKSEYDKLNGEFGTFKSQMEVKAELGEHFELLSPHIDYSKEIKPQLETVKTKFASLFTAKDLEQPKGKLKNESPAPKGQLTPEQSKAELQAKANKGDKQALRELRRLVLIKE